MEPGIISVGAGKSPIPGVNHDYGTRHEDILSQRKGKHTYLVLGGTLYPQPIVISQIDGVDTNKRLGTSLLSPARRT